MKTPYQLTPMHAWHMQNGAQTSLIDGWIRVLAYGDSQAEIKAGTVDVGICDVSPLSKIEVQGQRSVEVLREVSEVAMPDVGGCASFTLKDPAMPAYVARLTPQKFVVLAGAGLRQQLYRRLADAVRGHGCVHATDVTSAYAALQLIGPMSASLLKKLGSAAIDQIQVDHCVQTTTARVWSLLIHHEVRQGKGWLLLVSRDFGQYVWESMFVAGQNLGIRPFGMLAAQTLTGMEEIDVAAL